MPASTIDRATAAIDALIDAYAVTISIDGSAMVAWLDLDLQEHRRRQTCGAGAITSTGLLHGLWLLPTGAPVPAASLPAEKVNRLRAAKGAVTESDAGFERLYSPPGIVRAVAFVGRRWDRIVERAIRFTPIVQRYAIAVDPLSTMSPCVEAGAREWGVGAVEVADGQACQIVAASLPERGVPSVYRWWIAELAYRSWCYENTQCRS